MAPAAGGIRAVTLGAWITIVDQHGWADEHAWLTAYDAARAALPSIRRLLRPGEDAAEDLVSEALLIAERCWTRWRRPEIERVGLVAWLRGVLRNALSSWRRRASRTAGDRDRDVVDPRSAPRPDQDDVDAAADARMAELRRLFEERKANLTPRQREAVDLHLQQLSHGEAARRLGIKRDTFRDRLRRGLRRLESERPAAVRHDRAETAAHARALAAAGDTVGATLLVLRGIGVSCRAIAERLGRTVQSVRSCVARRWGVWDPSLPLQSPDADLPPVTSPPGCGARLRERTGHENGGDDVLAPDLRVAGVRGRAQPARAPPGERRRP